MKAEVMEFEKGGYAVYVDDELITRTPTEEVAADFADRLANGTAREKTGRTARPRTVRRAPTAEVPILPDLDN